MQTASSDLEAFSEVVSSVYSAAMDPSIWPMTLRDIVDAFDAHGGAMLVARPGRPGFAEQVGVEAAGVESYNQHYHHIDPIARVIEASPMGMVGGVFDISTEAERSRSEFWNDWALPNGAGDGVFCRFSDRRDGPGWLHVVAEPAQRFSTPARLLLMKQLVPHLNQAVKLELTLQEKAGGLTPSADALEYLDRGALLADSEGKIHEMNRAAHAILHSNDGIGVDSRGSLSVAFAYRESLQRMIARACGTNVPIPAAGSAAVPRPSGRRPYVLHAIPVIRKSSSSRRLALVTMVDPDIRERPSTAAAWRSIYGFTSRECVIAQHVLRGEGLQAVAHELHITLSTVRVHLRHIFEKTGTHRQAELARLLTATGPIFDAGN